MNEAYFQLDFSLYIFKTFQLPASFYDLILSLFHLIVHSSWFNRYH